jgi:hypothetical protein
LITAEECFSIWAPDRDFWSQWAKPVVFANAIALSDDTAVQPLHLESASLPGSFDPAAIVVDLPGELSVRAGLALAERGYRPVPLFNGTSGPKPVVPVDGIERMLGSGARILKAMSIPADARPAFLLDADRGQPIGGGEPGRYDNRWVVLPQDFPSGTTLRSKGIRNVTVIRQRAPVPDQDLTVVLKRWQEAGLAIRGVALESRAVEDPLTLSVPGNMRALWYGALALMGLRRSSVGGFGALIPEQTQRSGFYG